MNCDGNAGTSGRTNNCLSNSAGRRRRVAPALAAAGAIIPCGHALAQYAVPTESLWTTQDDFTGWTTEGLATSVTPVPSSTYDLDCRLPTAWETIPMPAPLVRQADWR